MKHGSTGRRSRSRNSNGRRGPQGNSHGNNKMKVFDSNGPDVRIRGTAHQVCEKYKALAKDALSMGNFVLAESYHQHAEHYQRVINAWQETAVVQSESQISNSDSPDSSAPSPSSDVSATKESKSEDDLSLPASMIAPAKVQETKAVLESA